MEGGKIEAQGIPWEAEMEERAVRINVIAAKVAVIAVPAFFITDIFIAPQHWKTFLIFRLLIQKHLRLSNLPLLRVQI